MTIFNPPLTEEDADTIRHCCETRILEMSIPHSGVERVQNYGTARFWMTELFQGRAVEIDEDILAPHREAVVAARDCLRNVIG